MKRIYIHTINGSVAQYHPWGQICYARSVRYVAYSLKQIRQEQHLSDDYRKRMGFDGRPNYGYVTIAASALKSERRSVK